MEAIETQTEVTPLKIRSSQLGRLMTGRIGLTDRQSEELKKLKEKKTPLTDNQLVKIGDLISKSKPVLGDTAKALINETWISKEYGRHKEIQSKYLKKGIVVEEDSIDLLTKVTGKLYIKNKKRYTNDWFSGEWDLTSKGMIEDIKSSWDIHTFHKAELTHDNYWQIMSYMDLAGLDNGRVDYCLVDTPDHLINDEFKRTAWALNIYDGDFMHESKYDNLKYQIAKNMLFTDKAFEVAKSAYFPTAEVNDWKPVPDKLRLKQFDVSYDKQEIKKAQERITLAREYYKTIEL